MLPIKPPITDYNPTVAWACTSASNLQQQACFVRTRCNKTINIWDQCSETSPVKWITGWSLQYYRLVHLWTGLDHTHSPLLCLLLLEFHFGEEGDANLASESEKDNACAVRKFPCFQWLALLNVLLQMPQDGTVELDFYSQISCAWVFECGRKHCAIQAQ